MPHNFSISSGVCICVWAYRARKECVEVVKHNERRSPLQRFAADALKSPAELRYLDVFETQKDKESVEFHSKHDQNDKIVQASKQ